MIAYEGFFLGKDEKQELSYKLSLRVAHYYPLAAYSNSFIFAFVKKAYGLRSDAVHGSVKNQQVIGIGNQQFPIHEVIEKLQEIFRVCLYKYITESFEVEIKDVIKNIDEVIISRIQSTEIE